jgi:hypothetical protein
MYSHYFSIDVESIGLYGEAFAVGWVVVDAAGTEKENGYWICSANNASGTMSDRQWIEANVLPHLPAPNCSSIDELEEQFWQTWQRVKQDYVGIVAIADCPYPVETSFLADCVSWQQTCYGRATVSVTLDQSSLKLEPTWSTPSSAAEPKWSAPYPLLDVATMLLAVGKDPLENYDRLPTELPKHNPVCDARQSARIFIDCLHTITGWRII